MIDNLCYFVLTFFVAFVTFVTILLSTSVPKCYIYCSYLDWFLLGSKFLEVNNVGLEKYPIHSTYMISIFQWRNASALWKPPVIFVCALGPWGIHVRSTSTLPRDFLVQVDHDWVNNSCYYYSLLYMQNLISHRTLQYFSKNQSDVFWGSGYIFYIS